MNNPIVTGIVPSGDEDRIPLSNSDTKQINRRFLRISPISLNDPHLMPFNPEEERRERRGVDHPETVGFAGGEGESGVFVETYFGGRSGGGCPRYGRQVRCVLGKVDQTGIYACRVSDGG